MLSRQDKCGLPFLIIISWVNWSISLFCPSLVSYQKGGKTPWNFILWITLRREVCLLFNVKTNLGNQVERINLLKRLSLKKGSPQLSCLLNINRISAIPWLRLYILGIEYLGTTSINCFCKDTDSLVLLLSSHS